MSKREQNKLTQKTSFNLVIYYDGTSNKQFNLLDS